jgi:hypothetical protein
VKSGISRRVLLVIVMLHSCMKLVSVYPIKQSAIFIQFIISHLVKNLHIFMKVHHYVHKIRLILKSAELKLDIHAVFL